MEPQTQPKATAEKLQTKANKNNKPLIVTSVVMSILAVAGCAFGVYGIIDANNKASDNDSLQAKLVLLQAETGTELIETKQDDTTVTVVEVKDNSEEIIKNLAEEVKEALSDRFQYGNFFTVFGNGSLIKISGTDIMTFSNESYGVASSSDISDKTRMNEIMSNSYSVIEPILLNNGFISNQELTREPLGPARALFYNSSTKIYCNVTKDELPVSFNCSSADWINEEDKNLIIELAEASGINYIMAKTSDIENSQVYPYQTLSAGTFSAALLFYRTSPEAKWQYFRGTQVVLSCEEYDTDDLRKAYAGDSCYTNESTGQMSTIQP